MENQKDPRGDKEQKPDNSPEANNKSKKSSEKSSGDAAYNAFQKRNDRFGTVRHEGESEMNDENRSGGAGQ